ncbi:Hypothetical protein LUCI_4314 [Lucifera butyrica]|uniref:Uncharacterized protein n=1 Tax=Lucifera butyrica TaxID=1351585 RepID=A0A498RJ32_9FIRM|nr:hypothetical protein [Lucifera butyrica]VBB09028.1 Hypothetical protein LUCI_4314 [Lucifera butyrica]
MAKEYTDEQIRRVINQVEEQQEINNQNIYEGVRINDQQYTFQDTAFFAERLTIPIPITFVDMPAELAKIKYPSGDRPQIIKTDETGSVNITLSLIPNQINDEHIPEVKDGIKTIFKRLNPAYLFLDEGVETIDGKPVGYFEFKSPALDRPLFNLMFVLEIEHNVMMGNFSCPYDDHAAWRPIARQIMNSVRVFPAPAHNPVSGGKSSEPVKH